MPKILPLTVTEQASNDGLNWQFVVDADDLTQATAATGQTINLRPLAVGDIVRYVVTDLKTPFQNTADTANNTTTVSVGDTGSATRFTAAQETNANGTFVHEAQGPTTAVAPYTAADTLQINFGAPATGKTLKSINVGEIHVYAKVLRPDTLTAARAKEPILTK